MNDVTTNKRFDKKSFLLKLNKQMDW